LPGLVLGEHVSTGKPRKRGYVIKFGLKPVLKKLGLPNAGLHAFRHGLGTALADNKVSPKLVQSILRHADIATTFKFYVHADADAQREALQSLQRVPALQQNVG
jgi:integrase